MAVGTAPPPTAAAALPCWRRLRERIQSERQVVGGLLKKAEALVARAEDAHGGAVAAHAEPCALPRRGKKSGRSLRPKTRPEVTAADGPKKKRKASPIVEAEVEVIESTMPKAQRDRLYGLLSSLSADMPLPPHIVGMMRSQCCCVVDPNGEEMDVDLGSAKDAALFQLLNLLEEFAQQQSKIQPRLAEEQEPPKIEASDAISRSSICNLEDREIADEGAAMGMDICGGVSPLVVDEVQFLPLPKQQEEDELIDICGSVSPVSVNNFPETPRSSSSDSSSSSSSSSDSDSSSSCSGASSGSSCAGSSSSSDSDSDDDADSASSRPDTTAHHPTEAEVKPMEEQNVMEQDKKLITERAASPHTEMQELIARAQERQKFRRELDRKAARELDRKMAREQLQGMKRTAQPVFDSIDPRYMKQLGISGEVQYIVSPVKSRDSLRRRGGGLLQRLGFFLKAEF